MKLIKKTAILLSLVVMSCLCLMLPLKVHAKAKVKAKKVKMLKGKKKKIRVKGVSPKKVKWTSSNKKAATVKNGVITAKKAGSSTIVAKYRKKKYYWKVKVVSVSRKKVTISQSQSYKFAVKNGKNTSWKSAYPSVASITDEGTVTGLSAGSSTLTCVTNGIRFTTRVYVASLSKTDLTMEAERTYQLKVYYKGGEKPTFSSSDTTVAKVTKSGLITARREGTAVIICKVGKAKLYCSLTVTHPTNIVTPRSSLPDGSAGDRLSVVINSFPVDRTYTIYKQSANVNKNSGSNGVPKTYMPNHGCSACAMSTVLSAYHGFTGGPVYMTEQTEKSVFGTEVWTRNYSKSDSKQNPIALYGMSRILNACGIRNEYVRCFPGGETVGRTSATAAAAVSQITGHLKTGNPVIIVVSKKNWKTNKIDKKWANSYHTMVLMGMTDGGKVIVADSADRDSSVFGNQKRIKYTTMNSLISYMISSKNLTSTGVYWSGENSSGGYILVNPQ